MQWCINNNITVGVLPTKKGLKVEINENGDNKISPKIYILQEELQKKVIELYLYIYKKYWQVCYINFNTTIFALFGICFGANYWNSNIRLTILAKQI